MNKFYLKEDDVIMRGESPDEYRTRLLRKVANQDIGTMDNHDRVHAALAYIDSIRNQYQGSDKNIQLVVRARGDKSSGGIIGYKVHGISPSGKHVITSPMAKGGGHKQQEETSIKEIQGLQVSSYPNLKNEHREVLRRLMDFRGIHETLQNYKNLILEEKKKKKPFKGFKKGKNHPEGGLSRAEARRQGIHAGIETKDEAKRKGGFGKLSKKTQKRRKSFCARMCGMKRRNTSAKTARDPDSKINAALRVWGCRCSVSESYEMAKKILKEEVVNKQHKGTMSKKELAERDRIAKSVKGIKAIKGKDSEKNARYRYATFVVLQRRKEEGKSESKPKNKKSKGKKKKKS